MNQHTTDKPVSNKARVAVLKYGRDVCIRAYRLSLEGEGANTIAQLVGLKTTQQADAAINAGEELAAMEAPAAPAQEAAQDALSPSTLADMARTLATLMQSGAELAQVPAGAFVVLFHGSALRRRSDDTIGLGGGGSVGYWRTAADAEGIRARFARTVQAKGADASSIHAVPVDQAMRRTLQMHADIAGGVLSNLNKRSH